MIQQNKSEAGDNILLISLIGYVNVKNRFNFKRLKKDTTKTENKNNKSATASRTLYNHLIVHP